MSSLPAIYLGQILPLPVDVPKSHTPSKLETMPSILIVPWSLINTKHKYDTTQIINDLFSPIYWLRRNSNSRYTEFAKFVVKVVYKMRNAFSVLFSGMCWLPILLDRCQRSYYDSTKLSFLDLNVDAYSNDPMNFVIMYARRRIVKFKVLFSILLNSFPEITLYCYSFIILDILKSLIYFMIFDDQNWIPKLK